MSQPRQPNLGKARALSTLGHALRTPVTSMRMAFHLLLEEKIGKLTADQREVAEAGRDDCEQLLALLQAHLELMKLESGAADFQIKAIAPADILMGVDAAHRESLNGMGVALEMTEEPPGLPEVRGDAGHVRRVLGVYLNQAARQGVQGSPAVLGACSGKGGVRFTVGFRPKTPMSDIALAEFFDPFRGAGSAAAGGAGLDLALCRALAAGMGGRTGIEGDEGETRIFLELPNC